MRNQLQKKRTSGFTIIEVMIVLAIAALILVIVFLAVPALQRNQRDNARESIVNRVKAEIETYSGNNQGTYPFQAANCNTTGCWNDFVTRYITAGNVNVTDPGTGAATIATGINNNTGTPLAFGGGACQATQGTGGANIQTGQVHICYGAKCTGENLVASGSAVVTTRHYAMVIGLDRNDTDFCVDNG